MNYGRILNNVRLQEAKTQELIATYQNTVLTAGREVQTPLRGFLRSREQAEDLDRSVKAATAATQLGVQQYRTGTIDFNRVFNLETTQVQQQDQLAIAAGNIALNLINVYRALGGGWELRLQKDPPPRRRQIIRRPPPCLPAMRRSPRCRERRNHERVSPDESPNDALGHRARIADAHRCAPETPATERPSAAFPALGPAGGCNPDGRGLFHWWNPDCFPRSCGPDNYCRKPMPNVCRPTPLSYDRADPQQQPITRPHPPEQALTPVKFAAIWHGFFGEPVVVLHSALPRGAICYVTASVHPAPPGPGPRLTPRAGVAIAITLASVFSAGGARTARDGGAQHRVTTGPSGRIQPRTKRMCEGGAVAARAPHGGAGSTQGMPHCGLKPRLASRPEGDPGVTLALAELWYRAALRQPRHDPGSVVFALAAAAAAALALADPEAFGCCDRAVVVHNDAVARLVRISQDGRTSPRAGAGRWAWPGSGSWWREAIRLLTRGGSPKSGWPHDVHVCRDATPVPDLRTGGPGRRHALRRPGHPTETDEQFFPRRFRIAATVLAAPAADCRPAAYRLSPLGLVFHDPFRVDSARLAGPPSAGWPTARPIWRCRRRRTGSRPRRSAA